MEVKVRVDKQKNKEERSNKNSKNNKIKRIICSFLIIAVVFIPLTSLTVFASSDSKYYSHISDEEMKTIFSLDVDDIPNAWRWITEANTFVILEERNGNYTYWWNTPNLQMTLYNMLYENVMISGYGNGSGINPANNNENSNVKVAGQDGATNAMERYGFNIPSPTYMGERPLITISIAGVLKPDSVLDGFGRIFNFIFDGEIISYPTDTDLDTLVYVAPKDYNLAGTTFYSWVNENWYSAVEYFRQHPGQILLKTADEDGMKDGKQWVAQNIIFEQGLDQPDLEADYICSELEEICGRYYGDVAEGIILASGIEASNKYERIMPYDLTRMNATDAEMFDGIVDPRAQMQENTISTGYFNSIPNLFANIVLSSSSKLSQNAVFLNRLGTFEAVEDIGINPFILWDYGIIQILLFAAGAIFLFYATKSAIGVVTGKMSFARVFIKLSCTFITVVFVFALALSPETTYGHLKDIANQIFAFGADGLTYNESLTELYGTSDENGKEDVNLWLPYFNVWTTYQTNHTVLDSKQMISTSTGPETDNLKKSSIDGVEQNLWSTILAEDLTKDDSYSGNIYRMVDHFLAPRIQLNNAENVDFTVTKNENYNGNIQSAVNWGAIPMQILILFLTFLKVILFFEFIFNFAFLIVNMALTIKNTRDVIRSVQRLFASMVDVAVCNLIVTLIIWTSLKVDGILSVLLFLFYSFIIFQGLKELVSSNSVFSPRCLRKPIIFIRRMLINLIAPNGTRVHKTQEDLADEAEAAANEDGGDDNEDE